MTKRENRVVADWGKHYGWVIIDPDASFDDGEGGYDPMAQLCVAGFKSQAAAQRWLRVRELARACGVSHGFRLGIGYD